MKILVAVHDLTLAKWHLMPWRTVVEVVKCLRLMGHTATLVSLDSGAIDITTEDSDLLPAGTLRVSKQRDRLESQLKLVCEQLQPDVLFWPVTWRDPRWRTRILAKLPSGVVGWFPGGVYTRSDALYALSKMGLRPTIRYLLEAFYPKSWQMRFMRNHGVDALLAMTALTARVAVKHGWPSAQAFVVPPGRDTGDALIDPLPEVVRAWLADQPYLLFMGPPSAIRGIDEVLDAFAQVARTSNEARLICLFRGDGVLERDRIERKISSVSYKDRIYAMWESLPRPMLNGFMQNCRVVAMPFILVPSEIPLAIIEVAAYGKPVLTTRCGGTGEFVADFGAATPVGDVDALAREMHKMFSDEGYYKVRCQAAAEIYARHPLWGEVAQGWANVAEEVTQQSVPQTDK